MNPEQETFSDSGQSSLSSAPWDFRETLTALGLFLVFMLALLALMTLMQIGIFFLSAVISVWFERSFSSAMKLADSLIPYSLVFIALLEVSFLFGLVWFFAVKRHSASRRDLGFVQTPLLTAFGLVALSMAGIWLMSYIYTFFIDFFWKVSIPEIDLVEAFGGKSLGLALAIVLAGLLTPVAEEVFFRGFVYPGFRDKLGVFWAVVVSSLIFGLSHLNIWLVAPTAFIGAVAALLYEKTGSIYSSISIHILNNLLAMVFFYLKS